MAAPAELASFVVPGAESEHQQISNLSNSDLFSFLLSECCGWQLLPTFAAFEITLRLGRLPKVGEVLACYNEGQAREHCPHLLGREAPGALK